MKVTDKLTAQSAAAALRHTGVFLWQEPLQSLYLAMLVFVGVLFFSQQPQTLSSDDIFEEAPPIVFFDDSPDSLAPVLEEPELEDTAGEGAGTSTGEGEGAQAALDPAPQATTPAPPSQPNWLEYRVRRGDTMDRVLRAIKADDELRAYLNQQKFKTYRRLKVGDTVYFLQGENGALQKMLYKTSPEYYFTAGRDDAGEIWAREEAPVIETDRYAHTGTIEEGSSFYVAADKAGMSALAINKVISVLETQIDFYREVRAGDTFRVVYEEQRDEHGDVIAAGDIVAFEYDNKLESRPRTIRGVYYNDGSGISGYYSPEGESLQRAFLPAPLKYRRVSSRFTHRRLHPVLKKWRAHRGVDYAAPSGTPVYSTADGIISKVERQRGYGNVVFIKHFNNVYTTVYAHLRAFKKGVRRGKHVAQGEVIGYVGQTGLATGPHLHYEFRVRGKHKDPLSEAVIKQLPPLKGEALDKFQQYSQPLFVELDAIAPTPAQS